MQQNLPIKFKELQKLTNLNIKQELCRFQTLSLESDKYISVKDQGQDGSPVMIIVDLENGFNVTRRPMKAEAFIMHPSKNIIALRAKNESGNGHYIQVFNMDTREKMANCDLGENIIFWRWIDEKTVAAVGSSGCYHVVLGQDTPKKVFSRDGQLSAANNGQIIGYAADHSQNWLLLTAINTPDQGRTINGNMQLYFTEANRQQFLEGHAGCFGQAIVHETGEKSSLFCFAERKAGETVSRFHVMEIGKPSGGQKFKKSTEISYSPDYPNDFPVLMQFSEKYGVVFMITKCGFLFLFEIGSCNCVFRNRISDDTIFVSTKHTATDGLLGVNRKGQLLSIAVDPDNIVSFISNNCRHIPDAAGVAAKLAGRYGLPGADGLFVAQFNRFLQSGDIKGAARVAVDAPGGILRNEETINKFKQMSGNPPPIMQYFSMLLEKGKLNALESLELARPVLQQNRINMIENWLKEDKLECTEELGNLCRQYDVNLGLSVHLRSNSPAQVLEGFIQTKQFDKIAPYCQKVNYNLDWSDLLKRAVMTSPDDALKLAQSLTVREGGRRPQVDLEVVVDIFMSQNHLLQTTEFLIKALEGNRPDEGHLQTRLLELNLMAAPAVAKTILEMNMLSHFDKPKIAQLCERQGMWLHALNNYTEISDVKRVIINCLPPNGLTAEQINQFLGTQTPQNALECLHELIKSNRQNLQIVVQGAINYHQQIGVPPLIEMFEAYGSFDGLFYFLGSVINNLEDEDIYFKYIEAATKLNQVKEVERVIKETSFYDPIKVKNYLKEARLPDPRPLIFLCDKHGFIPELTQYLYKNNLNKFIEVYLFRVNPAASPEVLGSLIDLECDETYIKQLLNNIRANCPVEQLVQEVESRNKLRILQSWLEARSNEGMQTPELHNALAKIYIDINKDPQSFLINNQFYDSKVVGKYCEDRDPHLAYTAYKRAWGSCDQELVDVTNNNNLYRLQARYLVERQSLDLWAIVLTEENPHRRSVIDQVVAAALPETKNPEEVSTTVRAFMNADLPNELMELLEKIVLHTSDFSKNKNLQNLLILTAIKADTSRVMDYINRLENYDGPELASIALGPEYQLYEEAFVIYKKSGNNVEAIEVLLNNIESLERAQEFAEKVNLDEVWSKLAKAQLENNFVTEAIESFLKAKDTSCYHQVIQVAEREEKFEDLAIYLKSAREQNKDQVIDNELLYSYARCEKLEEVETFITLSNSADISSVGDRCYNEKMYEAAKLLFQNVGNNAKLASCLVNLGQFQSSLEAAKKANTPKTWKEINFACVKAKEFRLAAIAGSNIIIHPDHLEELILHYEKYGYYDELISLLESGLGLERAHIGLFTELGILYAKYRPERLMDHCRSYYAKLNIPKLYRACDRYRMWPEAVFLYMHYDEHDSAIITMMEHSPSAWQHELFVQNILKVANQDLYYRAITFYLEEEPMLLNDLLKVLSQKIDHAKVVQVVKRTGYIALILDFLKSVQHHNNNTVNDAINEVLVENEDWEGLRTSIQNYDNFDQITMAQRLEKHQLLELRRIAAVLYRLNKRFEQSIELSKKEEMFKDAMETASESKDPAIAEKLLRFFVQNKNKECFSACTFTCYELLKPDLIMELAWRFGYMEFAMPYFIQSMSHMNQRIGQMEKKFMIKDKQEEDEKERKANEPIVGGIDEFTSSMMPGLGMPALGYVNPAMGGMNPGMMGGPGMGGPGMGFPQQAHGDTTLDTSSSRSEFVKEKGSRSLRDRRSLSF